MQRRIHINQLISENSSKKVQAIAEAAVAVEAILGEGIIAAETTSILKNNLA